MRHEISTTIDIEATPEELYDVITDIGRHPEWNPVIVEASGLGALGERLRLRMQPGDGRGMTFRPTVVAAERGVEFAWLGRLGVPGLFDGRHHFELHDLGDGRTRVEHGERFSGLLVGLLRRSLDTGTRADFERVNIALAGRVAALRHRGDAAADGPVAAASTTSSGTGA